MSIPVKDDQGRLMGYLHNHAEEMRLIDKLLACGMDWCEADTMGLRLPFFAENEHSEACIIAFWERLPALREHAWFMEGAV